MSKINNYHSALKALLPSGDYWDATDPQSELSIFLLGFSEEIARLDTFLMQSIEEADPGTCNRTINQWIKWTQAGVEEFEPIEVKRTAILLQLKKFFEKDIKRLARAMDSAIQLEWGNTIAPLLECGKSRCGDPFSTPAFQNNFLKIIVLAKPPKLEKDFFEQKIRSVILATRSVVFQYS